MPRICFVCHGNICRSPMAEVIFRDLLRAHGLTPGSHRAYQLSRADYDRFDHFLCMD